jgi:hypothetical protein
MSKKISFDEAYSEAVTQAFEILGNQVSKIVTDYLQQKHSIILNKTAANPAILDEALNNAIDGGRFIIERRIIRLLYEKLGLEDYNTEITELGFEGKINEARRRYKNALN